MKFGFKKIFLTLIILSCFAGTASCESLFAARVSQNDYIQPRSLFYSPKAKTVGDIVSVIISEKYQITDNQKLGTSKSSATTASFANLLNKLLPGMPINQDFGGYGGDNSVSNNAQTQRQSSFSDTITAQVVQVLPNGNLVIQGHKTLINAGETTNVLLSGVVDPRMINQSGQVDSAEVSNLQIAFSGSGTVARSNHEGIINKYVKYLF
jgi:flagellar L-ring protein precursor FlgH